MEDSFSIKPVCPLAYNGTARQAGERDIGMTAVQSSSREKILAAARNEFWKHGFEKASLRTIAQQTQMTTGAIYGYFTSKQALFDALVEPAAAGLLALFEKAQEDFYALSPDRQGMEAMLDYTLAVSKRITEALYANRDSFLLVLEKAGGTPWENYVDRFVEIEVKSTAEYIEICNVRSNESVSPISDILTHALARSYFSCLFEIFYNEPDERIAAAYIQELVRFYHSGYASLFNQPRS